MVDRQEKRASSLAFLGAEKTLDLVDAMSEGVMLVDAGGIVFKINEAAERLHGGGKIPHRGIPLADVSPHDWIEVKKVLATGIPQLCGLLHLPMATVVVNRVPLRREGALVGVLTIMQDICNFSSVLEEIPQFRNLALEQETIIDLFEDVFLTVNENGVIRNVNSAYERLISLGRKGIVGRHIGDIQRSPEQLAKLYRKAVESGVLAQQQVRLENGESWQGVATPAFDAAGRLFRVLLQLKRPRHAGAEAAESAPPPPPARGAKLSSEIQSLCNGFGFSVNSAVMSEVVRQALRSSKTNSCVLITGESGVGKTMLASFIHKNSERARNPFVVINCGAIPDQLLESELFGYEKGAFTGANSQGKAGLVETANTGTLFLDEIGELKYPLQSKLLEVIEKKSFIRIGGTSRTQVDIRIIAATNKNIPEEIEHGRFRSDLFYRLNVIPLAIPPLRERPEDVRAMIDLLLDQYNRQHAAQKRISPQLRSWFAGYAFMGNMRELINIMEWLLVMSETDLLTLKDLPARLRPAGEEADSAPRDFVEGGLEELAISSAGSALSGGLSLKDAMARFEQAYLDVAMRELRSIQAVSEHLQVHFSTLWRKLVKYGLNQKYAQREKEDE